MNKRLFVICVLVILTSNATADTDLHCFIQCALNHNLGLKSERLSLSKEEIGLTKAKKKEFYPEVNSGIEWSKSWGEESWGFFWMGGGGSEKPTMDISSSISRPHSFGGKIRLNLSTNQTLGEKIQNQWNLRLESEEPLSKSARQILKTPLFDEQLQLETAKLNLEERINELIEQVINSYTQLQRLNSTFIIKTKELEDLQGNIEISKLKLEKGLIPEMDIFQMELQASSVLSEMETLKKEKRSQMARFAQVLGTQTMIGEEQSSQEDFLERVKVLKGYGNNSLSTYSTPLPPASGGYSTPLTPFDKGEFPQVKTKYIQLELAKRRLLEAQTKNAPVFIPAFTLNRAGNTTQEEFKASVKFTLYDKGVKKEEIKLAQVSLSQSEIELNNLLTNTKIDITTTLDEIKDTERRISVLDKDIGLSEKIYEIAKIKHQRGLISAKDLLEYQTDVFRKQKSIFEEQTELFLEYVKLLKITGELYHAYKKDIF